MCIGDHERLLSENDSPNDRARWEKVEKQKEWGRYGMYSFDFGGYGGVGEERKRYTWRKMNGGWAHGPNVWELRIGGWEEGGGEVVARWERGSRWKSVKGGSLWVRRRFGEGWEGGEDREGKGKGEGEERKWEVAVVLSLMIILENYVRRQ